MKLLIASATLDEIKILKSRVELSQIHHIDFLITGIGQMHSCFSFTRKLQKTSYDLIIQAGICGSVSLNYSLGELVQIVEDEIIDIGSTSNLEFKPLNLKRFNFEEDEHQNLKFIPQKTVTSKLLEGIKKGKGITSNTVHGDQFWTDYLHKNHPDSFESMEGSVSFFVGNQFYTPIIQIRAISNYVIQENHDKWEIEKAIYNLNHFLIELINEL